METHEIAVRGRDVESNGADSTIVRTGVNVDEIHVLFDNDEWLDFLDQVMVTFVAGDGETAITTEFEIETLYNSDEWAAQGTATIPWEICQVLGGVQITFFATNLYGDHIVTSASGTPLSVVPEGITAGSTPQGVPTLDAWQNILSILDDSGAETVAEFAGAMVDTDQGILTTTSDGKLSIDLYALSTALGL